jgi:anion-transporting  ArsA/GET3 family ATPase
MNLVAHASSSGAFEVVVIDTAPSRHAVDFVTYPARLAALLGGRTVGWLAGLAQRTAGAAPSERGGLLSWGTAHVESLIARVTGPNLFADTASLFGDLAVVRERFVHLTQEAADLLLGPRTAYLLVAAPSGAARDDVAYLARRLAKLGRDPRAVILNRADAGPAPWASLLRARDLAPSLLEAATLLDEERAARAAAADAFAAEVAADLRGLPLVRLPHVEAAAPEAVVAALSRAVEPHLAALLP